MSDVKCQSAAPHLRNAGPFQGYETLLFTRERPSMVDKAVLICELTCIHAHSLYSKNQQQIVALGRI